MNIMNKLREARMAIKSGGGAVSVENAAIEDLFKKAQEIIIRMNAAKLEALREVEKPFLAELDEIDAEMAFYTRLIG